MDTVKQTLTLLQQKFQESAQTKSGSMESLADWGKAFIKEFGTVALPGC